VDGYYAPTGGFVAGYWAPPTVVRVERPIVRERVYNRQINDRHIDNRQVDHFRR
jgi:hypothetical protein